MWLRAGLSKDSGEGVVASGGKGVLVVFVVPFTKLVVTIPTGAPADDIALLRLKFRLLFLPFPPFPRPPIPVLPFLCARKHDIFPFKKPNSHHSAIKTEESIFVETYWGKFLKDLLHDFILRISKKFECISRDHCNDYCSRYTVKPTHLK